MNVLLLIAVFSTTTLLVMAVYLGVADRAAARDQPGASGSSTSTSSANGRRGRSNNGSRHHSKLVSWIDQSGLRIKPIELISLSSGVAVAAAAVTGYFLSSWWAALLAGAVTAAIPFSMVALARKQRSDKIRSQLPDALDLMSRMLRAGQTIHQSLCGVAEEFDSPIADEFGHCYEQQNLGLSTEAAMSEMARRTGVFELRILVVALTIHQHSGGNLSEMLDNLAKVIRDRFRIQGQIRSLTADGRMQAAILLVLPLFLLIVLSTVNQEYTTVLFEHPWILITMFGFELVGAVWLHRTVSFDF